MGLFGKKKTPEEILAEGRAQFVKGDLKKSFITLHGLAAKGNPKACYYIGRIYLERKEKNLAQSFLTTAAKGGEQDAAALLAKEFGIRDYLPKDTPAAEPGAAADVTADEAMDRGLKAYDRKDYVEAMSWFRKAEMLGSARATLMIGVLFSNGFGFPKDAAKGLQYFLKAAEQGVSDAQLYAAAKYESGADGVPQDLEKAVYWYEKAAEQGEAAAQHNLALLYANGRGTAQDYEKARYWLQKSAAQDEEVSEYSRGALAQLEEMMSKSAPKPAPKAKTDEELYTEGARAYAEKNYAEAVQIWRQLAEKGMARAQDGLALLYYRGDGVEKDEKKSAEWYRKAAEQGHGSSCFNLAIFYERGIGVTKDLNEALRWAEKAKAAGSKKADNLIAEIRHNIEVEKNRKNLTKPSAPKPGDDLSPEEKYRKGMEMFRAGRYEEAYKLLDAVCSIMYFSFEKDENIYPAGQSAMGWMCETGNGTKIDVASASMHYLNAINNATGIPDKDGMAGFVRLTAKATSPSLKDCEAALDYAKQLGTSEAKKAVPALKQKLSKAQKQREEELFNEGVASYNSGDYAKALYWFEKAAQQGNAKAQFNCAIMYEHGEGTAEDKAKALYWYEKAAEQDNAHAQFNCGLLYGRGEGTEADFEKAISWIRKAADQGLEEAKAALVKLGAETQELFQEGWAAYKAGDYPKALALFERIAQQGDVTAQFNCGVMYNNGKGTAMDHAKALYWYEKAAGQGHAKAQFICGQMYFKGEGTEADRAKALYWYKKAAEQGDTDAEDMASILSAFRDVLSENKSILVLNDECMGVSECSICKDICGEGAIIVDRVKNIVSIDNRRCTKCGECIEACPMGAIDIQ